jgi:hypothetical protein
LTFLAIGFWLIAVLNNGDRGVSVIQRDFPDLASCVDAALVIARAHEGSSYVADKDPFADYDDRWLKQTWIRCVPVQVSHP